MARSSRTAALFPAVARMSPASFLALVMLASALFPGVASASIKVVTSLPDLADFARQVGGDKVSVDNIVRGDQNPHFVEVKPSYMMKLKSADIFLTIGMDLEMWAPQIVDGSRNTSLNVVDLSRDITKLEVPGRVDASQGDVHKYGNPHYWLDPRNVRVIIGEIVEALAKASPGDERFFRANADAYLARLDKKIAEWEAAMKPFAGRKIITFHKSWTYLAGWLKLDVAGQVEPNPGIAPSPSHTAEIIDLVRKAGIKAVLVEPFYDTSAPSQIANAGNAKLLVLPTSTGGTELVKDYIGLMEYDVTTLASALR
jgi:zinc/manganese transport system substrate-binding protein